MRGVENRELLIPVVTRRTPRYEPVLMVLEELAVVTHEKWCEPDPHTAALEAKLIHHALEGSEAWGVLPISERALPAIVDLYNVSGYFTLCETASGAKYVFCSDIEPVTVPRAPRRWE
jgi:hypothetical protein